MKKYRVTLIDIVWDDGKGEYDVSEAPRSLRLTVNALDPNDAIAEAMDAASENYGSLINEVGTIEVD